MVGYLKQATASQSRLIGPFLDDTDFKTAETGLTIANTDIKLSANGAAGASKNSGGGTHRNNGMYGVTFDATDTATVGELAGSVVVAGALIVTFKFFVLEEEVYDDLFGASAVGYLKPATAGRDLVVDAAGLADATVVKVGPTGSGTAQTAGDLKATLAALFTTALTEAYSADGAAPTVAQALFLIMQRLTEFAISSTTLTIKKLDGSTSAAVLTLNDATNPTSATRSS